MALTVDTQASPDIFLGGQIFDTAIVSGSVLPTTSTILFQLFGPDESLGPCMGLPIFTDVIAINGDGSYPSASFTPLLPGLYHWTANYQMGDPNPNNAPTFNVCNMPNENVRVSLPVPPVPTVPRKKRKRGAFIPSFCVNKFDSMGRENNCPDISRDGRYVKISDDGQRCCYVLRK